MNKLIVLGVNLVLTLVFLLREAAAQQDRGSMMSGGMPMMGGPMMVAMGLFWVLLLVLMVLAILWLLKQVRK